MVLAHFQITQSDQQDRVIHPATLGVELQQLGADGIALLELGLARIGPRALELLLEAILVGRAGVVIRIEIGTAPQSCQEHTEQHQSGSTQKEAS